MYRLPLLRIAVAPAAAFALIVAACGGDDGAKPTEASANSADTPLPLLATATPVPSDGPALSVAVTRGKSLVPTVNELKAMQMTEINADGNKKGITIAALAKLVEANDNAVVTIQGVRADGRTMAFVRKPLSEVATSTVLVIDGQNHLSIASSKLDKAEWLQAVVAVAFDNQ
jgi:hypothetical protein